MYKILVFVCVLYVAGVLSSNEAPSLENIESFLNNEGEMKFHIKLMLVKINLSFKNLVPNTILDGRLACVWLKMDWICYVQCLVRGFSKGDCLNDDCLCVSKSP